MEKVKYKICYSPSPGQIKKVEAIKGIRKISGLGLKEAKYFIDDLFEGTSGPCMVLEVDQAPSAQDMAEGRSLLAAGSCTIEALDGRRAVRLKLEEAAKLSIDQGMYATTREICDLILVLTARPE